MCGTAQDGPPSVCQVISPLPPRPPARGGAILDSFSGSLPNEMPPLSGFVTYTNCSHLVSRTTRGISCSHSDTERMKHYGADARQGFPNHLSLSPHGPGRATRTSSALSLNSGLCSGHSRFRAPRWVEPHSPRSGRAQRRAHLRPAAGPAVTTGRMSQKSGAGRWDVLML